MIAAALLLATVQATAPATPAPAGAPAKTAVTARLNLDTPVDQIAADAKGKAVLDADVPTLTTHPMYEQFKNLSLHELQSYAPDKMTDAVLAKVATDLGAIK